MKHQVKPSVLFAIVKIVEMNYTGHVCRLIVDELPVDAYGMKVLAAARELWVKQGKVCVGTGRTIGSSFPVVQIIGGEPMNYPQRVIEIVRELRDANPNVFIKLFTGFPDTARLLLAADALITDYSSVMFDFSVTSKPIYFFVPDIEHYRGELRGFYFDLAERAPGPLVRTQEELVQALDDREVPVAYEQRYAAWRAQFNRRDDGHAAERVVSRILDQGWLTP